MPDFLVSTGTLSNLHKATALSTIVIGLYLTGLSNGKPKVVSASLNLLLLLAFLLSILSDKGSFWALLNQQTSPE